MTLSLKCRDFDGPLTRELVREPGRFGLGQVPASVRPAAVVKGVCGFCSTGCGVRAHLNAEGQAVNLTPDPDYPVNRGMLCPKGWEAIACTQSQERATTPLLQGKPIPWERAVEEFVTRMKAVQTAHGPAAAAFISTGQLMTEEMAFLGSLAKFGMGMIHGDGNTRQCMATSVAAHKESFGFDAPPFTYADFEESDCLVFVGANPCIAHPIMWQRVLANKRSPEIIVIDPRVTETAAAATLHVQVAPRADLTLLYCLAHWLIRKGKVKADFVAVHTSGFDAFRNFLDDYAPEQRLAETGVSAEVFEKLAHSVAERGRVSFWWTMGVNQSHQATRTAQALINLALMTGNIGRPGTGANSITGQCNAMGSRLYSNTTNLLGGHDFKNPEHRAKIARALDIPAGRIPDQPSLAYDQILEAVERGEIRALWILCTNPAHSWMNRGRFDALRRKLDFLVVQDMFATTETARAADLLLPAAGWGEKEGTFINSERRIGYSPKISRAPGEALSDFSIFRLLAQAWGCGEMFARWQKPEDVFHSLRECSRGQPCEITGITGYAMLRECGGVQWPLQDSETATLIVERRLFEDGKFFTPDGRARFCFDAPQPVPEPPDAVFPFVLITGRGTSAQWHTETRTRASQILRKLHPAETHCALHPEDAAALAVADGQCIRITSRRGTMTARAAVSGVVARGQVFIPMHDEAVNQLTLWHVDPHSRQPSYKHCAVRIERAGDVSGGSAVRSPLH